MKSPRLHFLYLACISIFGLSQAVYAAPGSIELFVNNAGASNYDYIDQTDIPPGFGEGEFTLEVWIKPNDSFPVGPISGDVQQRQNWASEDVAPYSSSGWWYTGNFLLDGHNNGSGFPEGTFTLQFYGGGRVRWLFGDGSFSIPEGLVWSVGAYPASTTSTLLDGAWHQLTLVRRWSGQSDAQLELWIDGVLVDTETSDVRTNMRQWWTSWSGFPSGQEGWFWGTEKQAAVGILTQYEDYKGLVDEIRFWSRAKSTAEITMDFSTPVSGNEPGLVGHYAFGEAQGTSICDSLNSNRCMFLQNAYPGVWSSENAPLSTSTDTQAPSRPQNLQGSAVSPSRIDLTWSASTDNIGVTGYDIRRDGAVVQTVTGTSYSDTGLSANTSYVYTVAARDAAGNVSQQSDSTSVTTLVSNDTQSPAVPTGLQGTVVSSTQVDLIWTASSDNIGVTGYEVQRDGVGVATVTGTGYSDRGLAANTSYVYVVIAMDAAGNESLPSASLSVTTNPEPVSTASGGGAFGFVSLILLALMRVCRSRRDRVVGNSRMRVTAGLRHQDQ